MLSVDNKSFSLLNCRTGWAASAGPGVGCKHSLQCATFALYTCHLQHDTAVAVRCTLRLRQHTVYTLLQSTLRIMQRILTAQAIQLKWPLSTNRSCQLECRQANRLGIAMRSAQEAARALLTCRRWCRHFQMWTCKRALKVELPPHLLQLSHGQLLPFHLWHLTLT